MALTDLQADTAKKLNGAEKDNAVQRTIKGLTGFGAELSRKVGEGLGWAADKAVEQNPIGKALDAKLGLAEKIGLDPKVADTLRDANGKFLDKAGDAAKSYVRGVSEFGASTLEGAGQALAEPVDTAKGLVKAASAGLDAIPNVGTVTSGIEAVFSGKSLAEVKAEKKTTRAAIWDGIKAEHKKVEGEIGSVGAWTKAALDVGTIAKSTAISANKLSKLGAKGAKAEPISIQHSQSGAMNSSSGVELAKTGTSAERSYSYDYKISEGSKNLNYDPSEVGKQVAQNVELLGGRSDLAKRGQVETTSLLASAESVLKKAEAQGKVKKGVSEDIHAQKAVAWGMRQELKRGGARLTRQSQDMLSPFEVKKTSEELAPGFNRVERSIEHKSVNDSWGLMAAQRALSKEPDTIRSGKNEAKVYGGSESSRNMAQAALNNMTEVAPKLAEALKEVQFEKTLGNTTSKVGKAPAQSRGQTNGYVVSDSLDTIVIRDKAMINQKGEMATNRRKLEDGTAKDLDFAFNRQQRTVYHETAHLLDPEGVISGAPGSPFGKGTKTEDASAGSDFVSKYAQTNPAEDFAETVAFTTSLATNRVPTLLDGPVTPAMREKLLSAAEEIGTDPKVFEQLEGWN